MKIEIYADGSATIATKPGGYGWVMVVDDNKHSEGSGSIEKATNNDAEMEAAIQGLVAVYKFLAGEHIEGMPPLRPAEVTLVSDSQIILNWANGTNRFKQKQKMKKYNALAQLMKVLKAKTRWVQGHSGDEHNERCDKLAGKARKSLAGEPKKKVKTSKIERKTHNVFNIWFNGVLKIIDLENHIVENHNEQDHGPRGSRLEYVDRK